jgi:hypothetical protein
MPKPFLLLTIVLLALPLRAWGCQGHRAVAAAALDQLPPGLAPWFWGCEASLPEHAGDPDRWKATDPGEASRHFLDCDAYGGASRVPRDKEAARAMLGPEAFLKAGQLPWIVAARVHSLALAFRRCDRPQVLLEAAYLSHFVADLNAPLHTVSRGRDRAGLRARWETCLTEEILLGQGWIPQPCPTDMGANPESAPWAWLRETHGLMDGLLLDDLAAQQLAQRDEAPVFGARYWMAFRKWQSPHVREQLTRSAQRTSQMIQFAWALAGSPPWPPENGR